MADAPQFQGLMLFEHYEVTGHLLLVTSDATAIHLEPGDFVVKRRWATTADAVEVNRAEEKR